MTTDELKLNIEREMREAKMPDLKPNRIFELTRTNPIVSGWVMSWKQGNCTWDQMMVGTVLGLEEQNRCLMKHLIRTPFALPDLPEKPK